MKASLYLLFSAFMWGVNFHLLKVALVTVNFIEAAYWRYLFAVVTLSLFAIAEWPSWRLFVTHIKGIMLVGIFGMFGFNVLLFWGLKYTSSINASLIISLSPMTTLLLSLIFFKTKINLIQLLGILLGISGVIYLVTKGHMANLNVQSISKGDLLVGLSMILASGYHIGVKKFMVNISNQQFTFFTHLICLLCLIIVLPISAIPKPMEYPLVFWIAMGVFGIVGTSITYLLWNKGVEIIGPARAGIYMNVVPLSTAFIAIILGQSLSGFHYISGLLIVCGLVIFRMDRSG